MFSAATYSDRRHALMNSLDGGLVLLPGNGESPRNYLDNPYSFRQDSSFLYYFGLNQPDLVGVLDVDAGQAILFGDDLTMDAIVWMGVQPTVAERAQQVGVTRTAPLADLQTLVDEALDAGRNVHHLPPYRTDTALLLDELLDTPWRNLADTASRELIMAVAAQRNIKTAEEVAEIEKAVNTTVDMHLAAMQMVRPGLTEAQVAAVVHERALAGGGDISFPIIATINGQTLHNHHHGNTLESGQLFLLDAGAETALGYAGDMSSTIPVDPTFTERQKEIYEITLAAHEAAAGALRPGINFQEVHRLACRTIASGLKEMDFMRGDVDEAVAAGAHALFLPCGTGHLMGLDVHDMENLGEELVGYAGEAKSTEFGLKSLRLGRELEPGFVLTIEPGIYFIPELMDLWQGEGRHTEFIDYERVQSYREFGGIRNEEDFLITEDGARLLGKPLPKTVAEVEAARAG
jgi:Xaa-Pro aminopeptidase